MSNGTLSQKASNYLIINNLQAVESIIKLENSKKLEYVKPTVKQNHQQKRISRPIRSKPINSSPPNAP